MSCCGQETTPSGEPRKFYGKYRGKVLENFDPLEMGRLIVDVPALVASGMSLELSWALPCVPYAGMQVGFAFTPPIGANVWVEFEGGDPTHPIWSGCFWGEAERPLLAAEPELKVLKTDGLTLVINDTPGAGSMMLTVSEPAVEVPVTITIDATGLQITTATAVISMSPEAISAALPPTEATLTEGGLSVTTEGSVSVVAPTTSVEGDVKITGPVEIEGNVDVTGAVEIEGDLTVVGAVDITGDGSLVGALEVVGDIAAVGGVEVGGTVVAALCEVTIP